MTFIAPILLLALVATQVLGEDTIEAILSL